MAMKKRSQRRGFAIPRFYTIYLAVTVAVMLAVIVALGVVSNRLSEYESAQPKYVAADVFRRYFESINYSELLEIAHYDAGLAGNAEIAEYLANEIGDAELTYSKGSSNEADMVKYIVKAGSKQVAAIYLAMTDEKTEHGFDTYEFSYIELYLNTESTPPPVDTGVNDGLVITVDVPAAYSVMIDGTLLSAEYITSSHTRTDLLKYHPSDVSGVDYTVYTVTTLEALPESVVVTDLEGTQANVTFSADTNTYTADIVYSEIFASDYGTFVTEAIEGYAAFVQRVPGVSLGKIDGYFDKASQAYADVEAAAGDRWMVKTPSGNDFENLKIGEFYAHSTNIFSCHISFTQILHRDGEEDFTDFVDKYVFLHVTDDGYKIYEWYNG